MLEEAKVKEILDSVVLPVSPRNINELNLVQEIIVSEGGAHIKLASAALHEGNQNYLKTAVVKAINEVDPSATVTVEFMDAKPADLNEIKNVIAIMSGKGGVGKSLVAGLTAVSLRRLGYKVGVLDADITGPSVPKMFGISGNPGGSDTGILSVASKTGIEVMSINLLLPSEDEAVIWRGPLIARAITQFWEEVLWGKLDYLIVDLPPGTADAPLTVMQTLPVTGVVVVFTPQDLTAMIVKKAVKMAKQMNKPILGVVENMSYLYVEEIDKKIELFGKSQADAMAKTADAPLLGQIPIDPTLVKLVDAGSIESYDSEFIRTIGDSIKKSTGM